MLNQNLDIPYLNQEFAKKELIQINEFLSADFAESVYKSLNATADEDWYVALCPAQQGTRKSMNLLNVEMNQPFIEVLKKRAEEAYRQGDFSYRFKRTSYANHMPEKGAERSLIDLFRSDTMKKLITSITKKDISQTSTFFSSCYEKDDFLSRHDDGDHGELGFVYYLCPGWKPHWGGNIEFTYKKTAEIYADFSPGYNQLLLFSIKDLRQVYHEVKRITVNSKRLAFSGWFK